MRHHFDGTLFAATKISGRKGSRLAVQPAMIFSL
jgi:hypothetical protein